ncbi:MAG TPA: hypothetical protein VGP84_07990 [Gemmatimonadaceae bacterium]|nr:hypothetical protein [Gemmatimonadaceae bacterium]
MAGSAADRALGRGRGADEQYDLLTAALIGLAIGVGTTLMVRRGPSGRRPVSPMLRGAALGAKWAGLGAARLGARGASWARDAGSELWERIPRDEIRDHVRDYLGKAQEAIDDVVETELRDLRKALRRQRKRLGI